mmetsp:Transcript_11600/g.32390  ORF Transcript_11600/g.32390 Transcript_11600/m.32390 type:complete len:419 (+) Transcript_11600:63-1319(+)
MCPSGRDSGDLQPIVQVTLLISEDGFPCLEHEVVPVTEQLHEGQQCRLAVFGLLAKACHEHVLPALPRAVACLARHRRPGEDLRGVPRPLGAVDVPVRHAEEGEGQLRAVPRVAEEQHGVVPRRAAGALEPRRLLVLGAHGRVLVWEDVLGAVCDADSHVGEALRQRVIELLHYGQQDLVAQSQVLVPVPVGVRVVPHARHLALHRLGEDALPTRHEEPHARDLRVPPRLPIQSVRVAAERSALPDHLVPIVVDGAQEDRGDVHGDAPIPCKQGVHQGVLLLHRAQVVPTKRQVHAAHVLVHLVEMHDHVIKPASVCTNALDAKLDRHGVLTVPRVGTRLWMIPIRPYRLLTDARIHLRLLVGCRPGHLLVRARAAPPALDLSFQRGVAATQLRIDAVQRGRPLQVSLQALLHARSAR